MIFDNIFLHYFDSHFLEERGIKYNYNNALNEANIATKIAYLSSRIVIIPIASYIESSFCQRCINPLFDFIENGEIRFVGKSSSLEEYKERKLQQYASNCKQLEIYKKINPSQLVIIPRTRSATTDILQSWNNEAKHGTIDTLVKYSDKKTQNKIEKIWDQVPHLLQNKPVIIDNVLPLLVDKETSPNIIFVNNLYNYINRYYFDSFITEYSAGIISDLKYLYLDKSVFPNVDSISYVSVLTHFRKIDKLKILTNSNCEELFNFKNSPEWMEIENDISKRREDLFQFYFLKRNKTEISESKGVFIMNNYVNNGQAGAVGPNANVSGNVFTQQKNSFLDTIDLKQLQDQLNTLRIHLKKIAKEPDDDIAVAKIAEAQKLCDEGNHDKIIEKLKSCGKWAFDQAMTIGTSVAATALANAMGLG